MFITKIAFLSSSYPTIDHYPFNLDIFRESKEVNLSRPVSFFIGENGSGKSTLLRAIAAKCRIYLWGNIDRTRATYNKYEEALYQYIDLQKTNGHIVGSFFNAEVFNNFARILDEWASSDPGVLDYFGGESLVTKSHGQRDMAFFASRFRKKGLYLLDEPENALSPRRQLELLRILHATGKTGDVQYIIATHSPILLSLPGADIFSFDEAPISTIKYEDSDYYRIYKDFMTDRSSYLNDIE
jgi:predicted ATPase